MSKQKYILAPEVKILPKNHKGVAVYVIKKVGSSKSYQITTTIGELLLKFREPKEIKKGISEVHLNIDLSDSETYKSFFQLFTDFLKLEVLKEYHASDKKIKPINSKFKKGSNYRHYTIIKELSNSSKIEVYLANDNKSKKHVVIKAFKNHGLDVKQLKRGRKALKREFEILKKMKHPNINRLECFYSYSNLAVLSHIVGAKLEDFIVDQPRTNEVKTILINQLISCFSYIHEQKVIHGDIHLSNIMVDKTDNLKVIDFGYASSPDYEAKSHGGIPQYMPPERVKDHGFSFSKTKGNFTSEVFQLGIIIYFIIYETYPFQGYLWKEVAEEILSKDIQHMNFKNEPLLNSQQEKVLLKCLAKNPLERFKSASQLYKVWSGLKAE